MSFRQKVLGIVTATAAAFVALIVASAMISRQVEDQLATIEDVYVPRAELGPRLENAFARLTRGLQDAVAANDAEALAETRATERGFLDDLAAAGPAIEPERAAALRQAVDEYYQVALGLSRRLIQGET